MGKPLLITGNELTDIIAEAGVLEIMIFPADRLYACVDEDWLENEFAESLKGITDQLGITKWYAEEHDCDDKARFATAWAGMLHAATQRKIVRPDSEKFAIAFGEFWYRDDRLGPHAINFYVGKRKKLGFYEPQNRRTVRLSPQEIRSCMLAKP